MAAFVLVPGALHGPEHFDRLAKLLRAGAGEAIAVALPGDHSSRQLTALDAHVAAVVAAVDASAKPVVLFGHSTAGCLITAAAEQRSEKIQKLIFLAAETLPGAFSYSLEPTAEWAAEGRARGRDPFLGRLGGGAQVCGAAAEAQPGVLRGGGGQVAAGEDTMHARLKEGALSFDLASGHGPFVSCPDKLATLMLEIADMPAEQFQPLRQLCEAAWEEREENGIRIEVLPRAAAVSAAAAKAEEAPPPAKRPHVPEATAAVAAYRISKSRRDSTMAKVLKFPEGVTMGAPVFYWYESFVDDPGQYTNARLNVPERGHEPPLDLAGVSRSLCAEGVVTWVECSRVSCSWRRVVTKIPGEPWTKADDASQVWGIDGREWNGSYTSSETGTLVENLAKYAKGSADAFWEDVPRKAMALLESIEA